MADQELTPAQKSAATKAANLAAAELVKEEEAEAARLLAEDEVNANAEAEAVRVAAEEEAEKVELARLEAEAEASAEAEDGPPVVLTAVKGKITNLVTGEQYRVGEDLAPAKGVQHWEKRQIEVGLLKVVD